MLHAIKAFFISLLSKARVHGHLVLNFGIEIRGEFLHLQNVLHDVLTFSRSVA